VATMRQKWLSLLALPLHASIRLSIASTSLPSMPRRGLFFSAGGELHYCLR